MSVFKKTTWRWWEIKIIGWMGILLGFALGSYFGSYFVDWMWLIWTGAAVMWLYIMIAWFKKQ